MEDGGLEGRSAGRCTGGRRRSERIPGQPTIARMASTSRAITVQASTRVCHGTISRVPQRGHQSTCSRTPHPTAAAGTRHSHLRAQVRACWSVSAALRTCWIYTMGRHRQKRGERTHVQGREQEANRHRLNSPPGEESAAFPRRFRLETGDQALGGDRAVALVDPEPKHIERHPRAAREASGDPSAPTQAVLGGRGERQSSRPPRPTTAAWRRAKRSRRRRPGKTKRFALHLDGVVPPGHLLVGVGVAQRELPERGAFSGQPTGSDHRSSLLMSGPGQSPGHQQRDRRRHRDTTTKIGASSATE